MVYVNNNIEVTMTPSRSGIMNVYAGMDVSQNKTFDYAASVNRIYKGNGLICQRKMCETMTGCDSGVGCPNHPHWDKVVHFCGPIGTESIYMAGAYWTLQPSNGQQQLLANTRSELNLKELPTAYNTSGMY